MPHNFNDPFYDSLNSALQQLLFYRHKYPQLMWIFHVGGNPPWMIADDPDHFPCSCVVVNRQFVIREEGARGFEDVFTVNLCSPYHQRPEEA